MFYYVEIFWGSILSSISSMLFGYLLGGLGSFAAIFLVTIWVGYHVGDDLLWGSINGGIVALLGGILSFIIMIIMGIIGLGPGSAIMAFGMMGILIGFSINFIVGVLGGAIGSSIVR